MQNFSLMVRGIGMCSWLSCQFCFDLAIVQFLVFFCIVCSSCCLFVECGGKMHLREGEYEKAHTDFFEAFKNYDESGSPRCIIPVRC